MYYQNISNIKVYQFAKAVTTKYYRLGGLITEINVSQFWELQVQDQGVGRFNFL